MPRARRPHFAGQGLNLDQAIIRWMLPPLYPSEVDDTAVFIGDAAIAGMTPIVRRRLAEGCRPLLERIQPKTPCGDAVWQHVIEAVSNSARADRSCRLAMALCGTPSP